MYLQVFILILAVVLLYYGAEFTLESAEKIGQFFGLSPLVIGLLIVGFGTSLPEFFVSHLASLKNESSMALGNIIGSNIANLFLIMGISGLFVTLRTDKKEIQGQLKLHLGLVGLLALTLSQKSFAWWNALSLLLFFIFFLYYTFNEMKKQKLLKTQLPKEKQKLRPLDGALLLVGFVLLYGGGELLVYSGTNLGKTLGVSTYVISAVLLAFGTSFPELMTALLACYKKKDTDLITGNIIGSNIFNVSFVMTSIYPYNIVFQKSYLPEISVLILSGAFLLMLSLLKKNFTRISGVLFCGCYISMVYYWSTL